MRKKRKEITRKRDNGKWEVGNRKREREDCLEHGRRETEEEQRNVKTRQQTNKRNRRTEGEREDMRNKNGKIVDLKYKSKEDSPVTDLQENLIILLPV